MLEEKPFSAADIVLSRARRRRQHPAGDGIQLGEYAFQCREVAGFGVKERQVAVDKGERRPFSRCTR